MTVPNCTTISWVGGRVQRDIQLQPRGQSGSLGQQLAVLGLQGSQLAVGLQDLLHRLFSLLLPVKQLLPGESWAGCQQASSLISVPLEHRQSTLGRLQILPSLGERLPVGPGERLAPSCESSPCQVWGSWSGSSISTQPIPCSSSSSASRSLRMASSRSPFILTIAISYSQPFPQ